MRHRFVYLLILSLLCANQYVISQPFPQLRFQHLDEKDGLSCRQVTAIAEDQRGFMWLGTVNGLNRYDGYRVKLFYHSEGDSSSLPNNNISAIHNYDASHLWISTKSGLAFFNSRTYKCRNILQQDKKKTSLRKDEDVLPYTDVNNDVLLSTYEGLYRLNTDFSVTELQQPITPFSFYNEYRKYCYGLFRDRTGNIWSRVGNRIFLLDKQSKKVLRMFIAPEKFHITNLFFDEDNTCWVTTWGGSGLLKFNTTTGVFTPVVLTGRNVICSQVCLWQLNKKKYIVVASLGDGLFLIDAATMQVKNYQTDAYGKKIVSHSHINCVYTDKQHNLWLGTENGADYITASASMFEIIPVFVNKADGLHPPNDGRIIKNLFETPDGWWVGKWQNGGTAFYDRYWECKKYFKALAGASVTTNPTTQSYGTFQWKDKLYFSTDSGIVKLNTITGATSVFHPPDVKFAADARNIIPLNDSTWWVRSHVSGIYIFNPLSEKYTRHFTGNDSCKDCLPFTHYEYMLRSATGDIWITTESGLYQYEPDAGKFKIWRRNTAEGLTFPSNKLSGMAEDANGNLWIGSEAGICMFNPATGKVEKVFKENTNISIVFRVCTDAFQNVWFNSQTGIWCWLRKDDKLVKFGTAEGIPGGYEIGVLEKASDGSIYAGCTDALVHFNPAALMNTVAHAYNAVITEATIENKAGIIAYESEKMITLKPGEKAFSIDFTVLNYDLPAGNQYYYRLLPHSPEWVANSTGHLSFYNLPPGTHRLEVKGRSRLGDNSGLPDAILVVVSPYWYQTSFFKLLVLLLTAGMAFVFFRWRIAQVKKQATVKQKIAETEMQALRAQMNPHFIFNSLNSIENFIMKSEKRLASDYLNKFARLIRMILDSSRNEVVPFAKDMEALQLYVDLEQLRFNNKFSYSTVIDPALLNGDYRVPSLIIQPYVENAIVHGLAHSENDQLVLTVMATLHNDVIKYSVQDNGVGREKAAGYNRQNKPQHKSIGLKITEDRINIFNKNKPPQGAVVFTDLYNSNQEPAGTKVEIIINAK